MKGFLVAVSCITLALLLFHNIEENTKPDIRSFQAHLKKHNIKLKSITEVSFRFQIFQNRIKQFKQHNSLNLGWKKGSNRFTHLTDQERRQILNISTKQHCFENQLNHTQPLLSTNTYNKLVKETDKPFKLELNSNRINWKDNGYLPEVKDMKDCGASYAFAVTSAIESNYLMSQKTVQLSSQELIDCSTNKGCSGGDNKTALEYILYNKLSDRNEYPFMNKEQTCKSDQSSSKFGIRSLNSPNPTINSLLKYVGISPIVSSLNTNQDFLDYDSGIYDAESSCGACNTSNFSVLVYGFDLTDSIPFINLQVSFGKQWGEDGYMRMSIGEREKGPCYIAGGFDNFYAVV